MKKIYLIIIFIALIFIYSGCNAVFYELVIDTKRNQNTTYGWELEVTATPGNLDMRVGYDNAVDLVILWGDGAEDTVNGTSDILHSYGGESTFILKIRGQATRINFNNAEAHATLTGILSPVQDIDGITSFYKSFYNCSNITGPIPAGLFDNNTLVTNFQYTFQGCSGLTGSIPAGLFDDNTQVTTFSDTFQGCSGLTGSIPASLFDNNTQVTTFRNTFHGCIGLTGSIPDSLFDNNTQVTNFQFTFQDCSGLTGSIPDGLFDNNEQVTNFQATFNGCSEINGTVPELWVDTAAKFPLLTTWIYCFTGTTLATNYASIPNDWGGL